MADAPRTALDVLARERNEFAFAGLPEVWAAYASERRARQSPFAAAVRVAARSDRLGHAFAVGYPAALEHLIPDVGLPCALCVTEANGNSPRAIATSLSPAPGGYRLDGNKTFVTFGTLAKALIVVARVGEKSDGRPDLAVVRIPAERVGVRLVELPPTPFVPEVVHASVHLDGAEVRDHERLPGDGYLEYVKPFRTVEDIHVVGATLGYLVGLARRVAAPPEWTARLLAQLASLEHLRERPPLDPSVHIALHGVYQRLNDLTTSEELARLMAKAPDDERSRWERDRALLRVAAKARAARFERAAGELL